MLPTTFNFLQRDPALLMTFRFNRAETYIGQFSYQAIARLKPDVTLEQANADVGRMIPLMMEQFPLPKGFTRQMLDEVRLGPERSSALGGRRWRGARRAVGLLGTVGMVLLIACANVANLFLVRAESRQQEFALRAALGADRARLAREVLTESVAIALAAGALGLVLARAGIALLIWLAPQGLPRGSTRSASIRWCWPSRWRCRS